jgi:hypothetical protein
MNEYFAQASASTAQASASTSQASASTAQASASQVPTASRFEDEHGNQMPFIPQVNRRDVCPFGVSCPRRGDSCGLKHTKWCNNGSACSFDGCIFTHPTNGSQVAPRVNATALRAQRTERFVGHIATAVDAAVATQMVAFEERIAANLAGQLAVMHDGIAGQFAAEGRRNAERHAEVTSSLGNLDKKLTDTSRKLDVAMTALDESSDTLAALAAKMAKNKEAREAKKAQKAQKQSQQ